MAQKRKDSRREQHKTEDKVVGRIVKIIVLTLLVVALVFGFSTYKFVTSSLKPLNESNKETKLISIPTGSSNKAIGEILEESHIIKSGMVFNYYTKFNNLTGFQAGKYQFSPSMTLDEIGEQLQNGGLAADQADARITIKEGVDVDEIGDLLAKDTEIKKKDFIAALDDDIFFDELVAKYPNLLTDASKAKNVKHRLEGYLFPATYDYYDGMTAKAMITEMVGKTDEVLSNYYDQIEKSDFNVHETLTLASLVEKEGTNEEDRKKIAQVFFNRIDADMPLQSDISILYALGEHKELVTYDDLEVDSPYNLYQNKGFGPGPFGNPSEQAIDAVLNPIPNDYIYFVADLDTGKVYYAKTLEEHNMLVEKYVNNRN